MYKKITFNSNGLKLKGNLFYPKDFDATKKYSAIIVSGSWTTVKEQMAGLYASKLAEKGFIALAFDFRNFGESEGEPRFFESPKLKKEDIKSAVSYLYNHKSIHKDNINLLGVCAGAMYTFLAAAEDERVSTVVSVVSWLHDNEAIKYFYGGDNGVKSKIKAAKKAKIKYANTGETDYIPTISETDKDAAMYGSYDYYLNPDRGNIEEWSNDKFAVASWEDWLTVNPMKHVSKVNKPTLMIHSDGAVLPNNAKEFYSALPVKDKELIWIDTDLESPYHQFDFYDQETEVNLAVKYAWKWYEKNKN